MFSLLKNLWNDESGVIISTEMCLMVSICGIGLITGLTEVRNAVVNEMADMANAVGSVDQSYSYSGTRSGSAWTSGSRYNDQPHSGASQFNGQYCIIVNQPDNN